MLMPTRIFPFLMLSQYPSIAPCLWSPILLLLIHRAASIGRGPLHSAPLKVMNHRLQQLLQFPRTIFPWNTTWRVVLSLILVNWQSWKHSIILLATSATQNTVKYDSRYYSNLNVGSVAILWLCSESNRPFARWRYFTTTTKIIFVFPFISNFCNPSEFSMTKA